jgi:hypothetical protein
MCRNSGAQNHLQGVRRMGSNVAILPKIGDHHAGEPADLAQAKQGADIGVEENRRHEFDW